MNMTRSRSPSIDIDGSCRREISPLRKKYERKPHPTRGVSKIAEYLWNIIKTTRLDFERWSSREVRVFIDEKLASKIRALRRILVKDLGYEYPFTGTEDHTDPLAHSYHWFELSIFYLSKLAEGDRGWEKSDADDLLILPDPEENLQKDVDNIVTHLVIAIELLENSEEEYLRGHKMGDQYLALLNQTALQVFRIYGLHDWLEYQAESTIKGDPIGTFLSWFEPLYESIRDKPHISLADALKKVFSDIKKTTGKFPDNRGYWVPVLMVNDKDETMRNFRGVFISPPDEKEKEQQRLYEKSLEWMNGAPGRRPIIPAHQIQVECPIARKRHERYQRFVQPIREKMTKEQGTMLYFMPDDDEDEMEELCSASSISDRSLCSDAASGLETTPWNSIAPAEMYQAPQDFLSCSSEQIQSVANTSDSTSQPGLQSFSQVISEYTNEAGYVDQSVYVGPPVYMDQSGCTFQPEYAGQVEYMGHSGYAGSSMYGLDQSGTMENYFYTDQSACLENYMYTDQTNYVDSGNQWSYVDQNDPYMGHMGGDQDMSIYS